MVGNRTPVYPDLVLIENGVPRAVIVLSEQPTERPRPRPTISVPSWNR